MLPDRVSNPGPLTYESGVLPIALRGPAIENKCKMQSHFFPKAGDINSLNSLVILIIKICPFF